MGKNQRTIRERSTDQSLSKQQNRSTYIYFLLGILCLAAFFQIGNAYTNNYQQSLFFFQIPDSYYTYFMLYWTLFGSTAAFFFAKGIAGLLTSFSTPSLLTRANQLLTTKAFLVVSSFIAFFVPYFLSVFIFDGAYFTDDESAYEYSAKAIAKGQLYLLSPDNKLFFDRAFMINDGKYYSQYFIGWPFFFAIGLKLELPDLVNPLLSALSIYPLYKVASHFLKPDWAKVVILLVVTSPAINLMAATKLSHTSCMFALLWATHHYLSTKKEESLLKSHSLFAVFFSISFFIRPLTALAICTPMLVGWCYRTLIKNNSLKAVLVFILPALLFASAFLTVNYIQNGSVTKVAYQRSIEYDIANDFRFSGRSVDTSSRKVANLGIKPLNRILETASLATVRHNFAIQGWPLFMAFSLFAFKRRYSFMWVTLLSFYLFHLGIDDAGFGTIAPVHFFEQSWLWVILVCAGLREISTYIKCYVRGMPITYNTAKPTKQGLIDFIPALIISLTFLSILVYWPLRAGTAKLLASASNYPITSAIQHVEKPAIIFSGIPFVSPCITLPARLSMFHRPNSLPEYAKDILWVNNVGQENNQMLAKKFPARHAYTMQWDHGNCKLAFNKIEK
ncbi:MAG: hypothetical protein GY820_04325 [Gammaproteobacteria bacterium]|nr:hypothetical protein [Gammaproteobacteria bacterium]